MLFLETHSLRLCKNTFTFILIIYKNTCQNGLAKLINNIYSKSGNNTNRQLSENKQTNKNTLQNIYSNGVI